MIVTQFKESLFKDFVNKAFPQSLADGDSVLVYPDPSSGHVFRTTEEGVQERGVATASMSDGKGVLVLHKFSPTLLALTSEVGIGNNDYHRIIDETP